LTQIEFASITMKAGDPLQAVAVGIDVLDNASTIKSSRLTEGLRGLVRVGTAHEATPEVADLRHHIGTVIRSRDLAGTVAPQGVAPNM
jgi:hypothetical protein